MRALFLLAVIPAALSAQNISVGAIGGVPFLNARFSVQSGTASTLYKSTNFSIGPALQVNLPLNFRIEADALYTPSSFQIVNPFGTTDIKANQWRFPVLLQYRFKAFPVVKPFVSAGGSFDHLSGISTAASGIASGSTGQLLQKSHGSLVLGGGVDVKVPFVRISGELRFTRQGSEDFRGLGNLNQAEFLVGIHF